MQKESKVLFVLKKLIILIPFTALLFFYSCASLPQHLPTSELKTYKISDSKSLLSRHAPLFIIEKHEDKFNLIGTASVQITKSGNEKIFIDHSKPTIYTETRAFQTSKTSYTNLIYRIHFEKVPFKLIPFYIGKGKNVGLITIVTLNSDNKPVLYTTVHTCGCYIAFVPTSYTPDDALPKGWGKERQSVFGESLPGFLDFEKPSTKDTRLMLLIGGGSHRVKDMWLARSESLKKYKPVISSTQAMASLEELPWGEETSSFYETSERRKGYVKGSHKPWERLLMSWWAFDWRIGEDKKLGENKDDGPLFYTSLKPWTREKSDLRDFATFLSYWGWGL